MAYPLSAAVLWPNFCGLILRAYERTAQRCCDINTLWCASKQRCDS